MRKGSKKEGDLPSVRVRKPLFSSHPISHFQQFFPIFVFITIWFNYLLFFFFFNNNLNNKIKMSMNDKFSLSWFWFIPRCWIKPSLKSLIKKIVVWNSSKICLLPNFFIGKCETYITFLLHEIQSLNPTTPHEYSKINLSSSLFPIAFCSLSFNPTIQSYSQTNTLSLSLSLSTKRSFRFLKKNLISPPLRV